MCCCCYLISSYSLHVFYGCGFIYDGCMILDINYGCCNVSSYFSLIAFTSSFSVGVSTWHARLGHIGQDRMNRLARDGILGQLTNINLP